MYVKLSPKDLNPDPYLPTAYKNLYLIHTHTFKNKVIGLVAHVSLIFLEKRSFTDDTEFFCTKWIPSINNLSIY